ncbi:MAG: 3-dehydroquinate synthase [Nitrospirae bacterium]|nr:3-dehydroquinate synthase [Nitrospirota bacterium]
MKEIQQKFQVSYSLPVIFTRDVFGADNKILAELLSKTGRRNRILIVLDSNVFNATPKLLDKIEQYASRHGDVMEFVSPPFIIKGGEACKKDMSEVDKIHALIDKYHLCRHSFILVIGGGAVLDAAGYAAATAHRGIRLIRMPTTTLSQNDAGVGVKNAVNAFGRKNFLGTFAPPFAIINDFDFLNTLPKRTLRAGIAEAVKVALIKDKAFFDFLYDERQRLASFEPDVMEKMIIRCAELHIEHIGTSGDPFEYGSSRPLDFGHWSAHKMEELTGGKIQHGEAVAAGIALDSLYSFHTGLINELELRKIFSLLEDIGFELFHWSLSWMDINSALREFQEHLGGRLTIPLLNGIGNRIDINEIDAALLKKCVNTLSETAEGKERRHASGKRADAGKRGSRKILP